MNRPDGYDLYLEEGMQAEEARYYEEMEREANIKKDNIRSNPKAILQVVELVKDECPNHDKGGLCTYYPGCLVCWQQYLRKIVKNEGNS